VIVSDILDFDHQTTAFHTLDNVKTKNLKEPVKNFTDCERFQSLTSNLISPGTEINLEEVGKEARDCTAAIALAHRLSTNKVSLSDINNQDLPGLDRWLKHRQRL
jgi:hypothetical protein